MLISGSKLYLNRLTTPTTRLPHPLFLPFFCSLELALHSTGILGCARDKVTENVSRSWRWRWRRSRRRRRSRHCCRRCCKCLKVNFEFKIHHVTQYVDLLNTNAKSSDSTNASLYSEWGGALRRRLNVKCGSERKMAAQAKIHTPLPLFPICHNKYNKLSASFDGRLMRYFPNNYLRLFCCACELKFCIYKVYI